MIAERTGTDPDRDIYPRLVTAVVRAVGDAATELYVRADPPVPITTLIRPASPTWPRVYPNRPTDEEEDMTVDTSTSSSPVPDPTV